MKINALNLFVGYEVKVDEKVRTKPGTKYIGTKARSQVLKPAGFFPCIALMLRIWIVLIENTFFSFVFTKSI